MGNNENLVSYFFTDFSHLIDLTEFVKIADESTGKGSNLELK